MQLSKHFKLEEMTKSMTATRKGIDNSPGAGDIKNLENVCYEILEPVRAHFDKPITITSGYRSEALCEAIGSKKTSQHAKGQAVDFEIMGVANIQIAYWIYFYPFLFIFSSNDFMATHFMPKATRIKNELLVP